MKTVGELRQALYYLPNNMPIHIEGDGGDFTVIVNDNDVSITVDNIHDEHELIKAEALQNLQDLHQ